MIFHPSQSPRGERAALALLVLLLLAAVAPEAGAQYFGRNKVVYDQFDFRVMHTPHFDIMYYPEEVEATRDAGRMAERWYARHNATFQFTFPKRTLIFYADHPDFEQTNVTQGTIDEATGGFTESARSRVVMPFTGLYHDNDHVLGHEMVHVFQYGIADAMANAGGGAARLDALPLWLIEGMAEYLSIGRDDPNTAMWMRDAVYRKKVPTIKQLTTDARFFPYRYGQALWAYIGGRWGDQAVPDIYRASLRLGFEGALRRVLGMGSDSLSKEWAAAMTQTYGPAMEGRTNPTQAGDRVLVQKEMGAMNVSPQVSPDGKYVAFFSRRGLFSIDLFVADATTGKIIKKLASPTNTPHFDAISFIYNAGAWSPDGKQFAFVVITQGDQELDVLDVRSADVVRRIRVKGVGAISGPSWSPDGRTIAFSGQSGGLSDLYLLDLKSEQVTQLTNDRYADIQPSWSPDGRTLAFVTDRGPGTDFDRLTYAPLRLGLMDVATRDIRLLTPFEGARHLNPEWSPDGRDLFFLSTPDGFQDIYRMNVESGAITRVTRLATGVSGITDVSPAISVARQTGRILFSVFENSGYNVYGLDSARTHGEQVPPTAVAAAPGGILPPVQALATSSVTRYLNDPLFGLPETRDFAVTPYHAGLKLDAVAPPTLGVGTSTFGTLVYGGIAAQFSDQLGNHLLGTSIQANGQVQDIGGEVFYLNMVKRWNWALDVARIPYLTGGTVVYDTSLAGNGTNDALVLGQVLQRIAINQATGFLQYPFSTTRRLEFSLGLTNVGYGLQIQKMICPYSAGGACFPPEKPQNLPAPPGLTYGQAAAALVGDNSYFGFTSPIMGQRYRFQAAPVFGQLNFVELTGDYRRYWFPQPFTFAIRGLHLGRYGRDENSYQLPILMVGWPTLVRGYDPNSWSVADCASGTNARSSCEVLDRLVGSRIAVANAEFRIPLIGTEQFGLLRFPFLPTEVSPFVDAGIAWGHGVSVFDQFTETNPARVPVYSAGVSTRINVLGFAVAEIYWAHAFQRPAKHSMWGFQLTPGW